MDQRRSEHESWWPGADLSRQSSIRPDADSAVLLTTAPTIRNYWRYSRFEEPHRRLHEAGHRSIDLYEAGRLEEAAEAIKAMEVEYQKIRVVFEEFYRVMEQLFLEGTSIF